MPPVIGLPMELAEFAHRIAMKLTEHKFTQDAKAITERVIELGVVPQTTQSLARQNPPARVETILGTSKSVCDVMVDRLRRQLDDQLLKKLPKAINYRLEQDLIMIGASLGRNSEWTFELSKNALNRLTAVIDRWVAVWAHNIFAQIDEIETKWVQQLETSWPVAEIDHARLVRAARPDCLELLSCSAHENSLGVTESKKTVRELSILVGGGMALTVAATCMRLGSTFTVPSTSIEVTVYLCVIGIVMLVLILARKTARIQAQSRARARLHQQLLIELSEQLQRIGSSTEARICRFFNTWSGELATRYEISKFEYGDRSSS